MADPIEFRVCVDGDTFELQAVERERSPRDAAISYASCLDMVGGDVEVIRVQAPDGSVTRWEVAALMRYSARMLHGEARRG